MVIDLQLAVVFGFFLASSAAGFKIICPDKGDNIFRILVRRAQRLLCRNFGFRVAVVAAIPDSVALQLAASAFPIAFALHTDIASFQSRLLFLVQLNLVLLGLETCGGMLSTHVSLLQET